MKILVDKHLGTLIDEGKIKHVSSALDLHEYVQPASIDLPVGEQIYLVKQKFLPFAKSVDYLVDKLQVEKFDASNGVTLYKGQTYLIPCLKLSLDEGMMGKMSPKSSIGRIDMLVRAVFDHHGFYDTILPGSAGTMRLEVTPQSFNVKIYAGIAISQMMLGEVSDGNDRPVFSFEDQDFVYEYGKPVSDVLAYENRLVVSLGLHGEKHVGRQARYTNEVIDMSQKNTHDIHHFFRPVHLHHHTKHKKVILEKDRFYIFHTKEDIKIPVEYSVELVPFSHLVGELRVHYAGFFDPGFGDDFGYPGVLEVRTHEDIIAYHGQPICMMEFYSNKAIPEIAYGKKGNHYQGQQGPKLAKYFASPL